MSRSTKKPYYTDQDYYGTRKRRANKKVRKHTNLPNNSGYKKAYNSWNIRDWSFFSKDPKAKRK